MFLNVNIQIRLTPACNLLTWKHIETLEFVVKFLLLYWIFMLSCNIVKSISQVTAGFQTTNMLTALPSSFLEPLLSFSLTEDPEVRLLVLQILLSLIDRHDNRPKFTNIRCVAVYVGTLWICILCVVFRLCWTCAFPSVQHYLWHLRAQAQSWQVFETGQLIHEKGTYSHYIWS